MAVGAVDYPTSVLSSAALPGAGGIRWRLSVMMFLEFFIWGAWLPLIFGYLPSLGFSPIQQSWILNAFALASFVGMFFSNQFADRNFAAERFLAFSQLVGGLAILSLAWTHSFAPFFVLMLIHSLFYVPTISITNSIAFANLKDSRDFGRVRLWGTIGWIAAAWPFVFILADWSQVPAMSTVGMKDWLGAIFGTPKAGATLQHAVSYTFVVAGLASLVLAAFSLTLPHTPPKPAVAGRETFAWLEAMKLLKVPFVMVLFIVTFFDAAVHQCYFIWTNDFLKSIGIPANWVTPVMSIGQIAEILAMASLATVLKQLGWRLTMAIGILGHTLRFGIFALAPNPVLAAIGIMLHGVCYAFFFATVYIFVDDFFPKDARTSAQGLFNFLILGFGPFVANFVWPQIGAASIAMVPITQPAPNVAMVPSAYHSFVARGAARPMGKVLVTFDEGLPSPATAELTADASGRWSMPTQLVGRPASGMYMITATTTAGQDSSPTIGSIERTDFRKLFLAPAGTALVAAIFLLLLFRPPRTAKQA